MISILEDDKLGFFFIWDVGEKRKGGGGFYNSFIRIFDIIFLIIFKSNSLKWVFKCFLFLLMRYKMLDMCC